MIAFPLHFWTCIFRGTSIIITTNQSFSFYFISDCINQLKIVALTGDNTGAGDGRSDKYDYYYGSHKIRLILNNGRSYDSNIPGSQPVGQQYTRELSMSSSFGTSECIIRSEIKEVHILGISYDGWFVKSIDTSIKTNGNPSFDYLTKDPNFNNWVDGDEAEANKDRKLTLVATSGNKDRHIVDCGYRHPVCECRQTADECEFDLEVDEIRTFTRYKMYPSSESVDVRGPHGLFYYINDTGDAVPSKDNQECSDIKDDSCTDPNYVDGKSYRLAISVNGQLPGPTLIVHEAQIIILNVKNNLTTEGISIHWHGMHQIGSPWMDGVGQLTQCQIGPSSTFRYIYKASPSGTFWYHSHSGAQRTDGLFGALIIKESPTRLINIRNRLRSSNLNDFEDHPDEHTVTLLDWHQESSLSVFTQIDGGFAFYPDVPISELPNPCLKRYKSTRSYENGEVGPVPFSSGLINGKGKHPDVPYHKTRLSVFDVEKNRKYRFRLVGSQGLFAFKFSIDGHKLKVVGTDGYWIEPEEVDYIIIHSGERYDFILETTGTLHTYWMRAQTLEIDKDGGFGAPYLPIGNSAEAILHYWQENEDRVNHVIGSKYYRLLESLSPPRECTPAKKCRAANCPFKNFADAYNIECVNANQFRLLDPTPSNELPHEDPNCQDCTFFINFNFEGQAFTSSINGRNFILPSHAPQIFPEISRKKDVICNENIDCNPSGLECMCTYVKNIPYQKTIQIVLSAIGAYHNAHPIHLHGHSFFVSHVAYPNYDKDGFVADHNTDIKCGDKDCTKTDCLKDKCTNPSWNYKPTITVNEKTVRKDTVIIPAGGYAVIQFKSDNPGHWFLHCHIEIHQLEGMAVIINEAESEQPKPPEGMNICGDFLWDTSDYYAKVPGSL